MRPLSLTRAWNSRTLACVLVACAATFAATAPSPAASTGSSVVGATVLSSTSLTPTGCPAKTTNITSLGSMNVATSSLTSADCRIVFGSSNDTASLRMAQLCCGTTPALAMQPDQIDMAYGGGDGVATTSLGAAALEMDGMAMRDDGRIYLVGRYSAGFQQSLIVRLMPDGTLDPSFNAGTGFRVIDIAVGANEMLKSVVVLPDGGAVAVGEATIGGQLDGTVVRVTDLGGLEGTFNGSGWANFDNGGLADTFHGVARQPDGNIVAVGMSGTGLSSQSLVARYVLTTGLKDTAGFGSPAGFVTRDFGNNDHLESVLVEPSGRIVAGGRRLPLAYEGLVAAFLPDGSPDNAGFNTPNGYLSLSIQSSEEVVDIKRRSDGRFLAAIEIQGAAPNQAVVAGIRANGTLDTAGFNAPTGHVTFPNINGAVSHGAAGVAELPGGRIIMGGRTNAPSGALIGRLNADGTLDNTFGTTGTAVSTIWTLETVPTIGVLGNGVYMAGGIAQPIGVMRFGGPTFDDYANTGAGTDRDWASGPTTSFFATCLRDLTGVGSSPTWVVDGDNDCTNTDTDPWRAIPGTMASGSSLVGRALTPGQDADVRLRFAARAKDDQLAGTYEAPLAFEVTAPG